MSTMPTPAQLANYASMRTLMSRASSRWMPSGARKPRSKRSARAARSTIFRHRTSSSMSPTCSEAWMDEVKEVLRPAGELRLAVPDKRFNIRPAPGGVRACRPSLRTHDRDAHSATVSRCR